MLHTLVMVLILSPLVGSIIAGIFGRWMPERVSHWATISCVFISFLCALMLFKHMVFNGHAAVNNNIYQWAGIDRYHFYLGYYLDNLSAMMVTVVTFVSLLVHIYSVGYMHDDSGYRRFFAYMSLFTFAMLLLVMANNMLQLFIGWEGVGLVSYLLIGFWFNKPSAAVGSFKAFIVNRIGDFGLIIGMAAVLSVVGSLDYQAIFEQAPALVSKVLVLNSHHSISMLTFICTMFFIGAMGKSAQLPLHIWLPESMEGPTPISALIHAATMVTAGIYLVARMSPLFSLSMPALSIVLVVGSTGALFLGLLAVVEFDIKRIVAYSTMSQLGYMMAANGAGAYPAAIFHLFTHACFKALLFLAAGSVIMAMHHEQDIRKMGGLWRKLPWTYACFLIGTLALVAIPPFSGFYSKDAIIEAVHLSPVPGAHYAYWCLTLGALVTALYSFRALFVAFHGQPRMNESAYNYVKENGWIVVMPLVLLAIPSIFLGLSWSGPMLYHAPTWLSQSFTMLSQQNPLVEMAENYHGVWSLVHAAFFQLPFWFMMSGVMIAYFAYIVWPSLPGYLSKRLAFFIWILNKGYGLDRLNEILFIGGAHFTSQNLYRYADMKMIDEGVVNASGRSIIRLSYLLRRLQTGYLFHYMFAMIFSLLIFMCWLVLIKT